jgi:cytoplasmic iron level regulating protein YaaA (DUF328/UPF0246 family)
MDKLTQLRIPFQDLTPEAARNLLAAIREERLTPPPERETRISEKRLLKKRNELRELLDKLSPDQLKELLEAMEGEQTSSLHEDEEDRP